MTDSPMRDAAPQNPLSASRDTHSLARMDRWAGQVAAQCGESADFKAIAVAAYDVAEALERERTKRMKG